jgi:xanthine/uracil permease
MAIAMVGFLIFLMGTSPELFGLDRSPVVGFVQITVFLIGLAVICIGGYLSLAAMWGGRQRTIAADIGLRLVATGYVVAVASGMADVFGFGNQPWPEIPSFGRWQARGVLLGEIIIAIGFLLLIPPQVSQKE